MQNILEDSLATGEHAMTQEAALQDDDTDNTPRLSTTQGSSRGLSRKRSAEASPERRAHRRKGQSTGDILAIGLERLGNAIIALTTDGGVLGQPSNKPAIQQALEAFSADFEDEDGVENDWMNAGRKLLVNETQAYVYLSIKKKENRRDWIHNNIDG